METRPKERQGPGGTATQESNVDALIRRNTINSVRTSIANLCEELRWTIPGSVSLSSLDNMLGRVERLNIINPDSLEAKGEAAYRACIFRNLLWELRAYESEQWSDKPDYAYAVGKFRVLSEFGESLVLSVLDVLSQTYGTEITVENLGFVAVAMQGFGDRGLLKVENALRVNPGLRSAYVLGIAFLAVKANGVAPISVVSPATMDSATKAVEGVAEKFKAYLEKSLKEMPSKTVLVDLGRAFACVINGRCNQVPAQQLQFLGDFAEVEVAPASLSLQELSIGDGSRLNDSEKTSSPL